MKKFAFNLESLLRLRAAEAEAARGRLGEAVTERVRAEQACRAWEGRLDELGEAQQLARGEHPSAAAISRLNLLVRETHTQLVQARTALPDTRQREEQARAAWQEARRGEEVIEKLRARRQAEHRQQMLRIEEQEALDLFMTRAARSRSNDPTRASASTLRST